MLEDEAANRRHNLSRKNKRRSCHSSVGCLVLTLAQGFHSHTNILVKVSACIPSIPAIKHDSLDVGFPDNCPGTLSRRYFSTAAHRGTCAVYRSGVVEREKERDCVHLLSADELRGGSSLLLTKR